MCGTFGVSQVCAADFQELKEEFILKNQSLGFKNQVISKLSKRFRDPSWLGTVWHCSTSLYLGSWVAALPGYLPTEPHCPARSALAATAASAATAAHAATTATAATASMASPNILTFDAEGRAVDFDVWVDDLQLFL
ncbi:unnamed protein product [Closterium sp. NIES-53]